MEPQTEKTDERIVSLATIARSPNSVSLGCDMIVLDTDLGNRFDDVPERVNGLLMTLCHKGRARICIDLNEYDIKPDTLVVIHPKNYIRMVSATPDTRGSVLVCSQYVVDNVLPKLTDILPVLLHHRVSPVTHLSPEEAESIDRYYKFLRRELRGAKTPFLRQKVMCLLQAALYELMDIQHGSGERMKAYNSRSEEIMARFILMLGEHFRGERNVAFYADQLCISPKHLSSVVKSISGRTAGDWIESYVVMEAKVLLTQTDLTIQEIARRLKFHNQSFFGKYFKLRTGVSPTDYRRSHS